VKRGVTFWQALVLFFVLTMTVGTYSILVFTWHWVRQPGGPAASSPAGGGVHIVEPLAGTLVRRAASLPVRATLLEPGFVQAELQVDGRPAGVQLNPDPQALPWIVHWAWEAPGEGAHRLAVEARKSPGGVVASAAVTVTVVPTGSLVFATNRDGAYALYAMHTDGREPRRLTSGPGAVRQPSLRAGGALLYVAEGGTGQATVRQLDAGGGPATDLFAGRDPAWSPDGSRLAFAASQEGLSQVFVAVEGGAPEPVTAEEVYAGQPAWSPDGAYLAYVAERDGNADIWLVALDATPAGPPRRLTDDPATDWAPAWSPDGTRLAFVSDRGGSHQVYVMRADGAQVEALTAFARGAESPAWSPDGFWLALVAYTGDGAGVDAREIYLLRIDGRDPVRLTHDSFDDTEPAWAPGP
jgi:Tol biopolymer transport system component